MMDPRSPSDVPGTSDVLVSFVIVNFHVAAKVLAAVCSIEQFCDVPFEVLVVDNSESTHELERLRRGLQKRAQVIDAGKNRGFGAGCNVGAHAANGRYLFLLNPDARLLGPAVGTLIGHLERHLVIGAVGAKLLYSDGREGHSSGCFIGLRRPLQLLKGSLHAHACHLIGRTPERGPKRKLPPGLSRVDWCSGAALVMRRHDFVQMGGFDERYFLYYEECDLQYRMQRRLGCVAAVDADVTVFHEDGGTGLEDVQKRRLIERGCLRFVHDHQPRSVYLLYKALMLQVTAAEALLSLARRDPGRASLHGRLLVDIARFRAVSEAATGTAPKAERSRAPAREGGNTWDTPTRTPATSAAATPLLRRARAS